MNLLLLDPADVDDLGRVHLDDERAVHLRSVLKVVPDQRLRVGLIDGPTGVGRVTDVGAGSVTLSCVFDRTPARPPVDLLLALPRPKVLRRLWAQLAALGVGRIILTNAERVERNYFDTHLLDPRVFRPLLIEGLQQARDTRVPLVSVHRQFRVLIEDELDALTPDCHRVVADPSATRSISDAVPTRAGTRVLLAIGPEGGWNGFELELLRSHGFDRAGLGARTLRFDTACIALLALVHDALGRNAVAQHALGRSAAAAAVHVDPDDMTR